MKIAIRGYAFEGETMRTVFDERVDIADDLNDLESLAYEHAMKMLDYPNHMIEVEFLDEPDPYQRFFRIGTDPRRMVAPIEVKL